MIDTGFVLAGRAVFTVANAKGEHYTYRVAKVEADGGGDPRWFASLLTGPDNTSDFTYLGMIVPAGLTVRLTKASKYTAEAKPVKVLGWALRVVTGATSLPSGYAIHHEGRCGRCGRVLTVPESIQTGLGPECAAKMGGGV